MSEQSIYNSHLLRKGRVSIPDQIYHVTTATLDRTPVFTDLWNVRTLVGAMRSADTTRKTDTLTFVVMPDHLHWLLRLKSGSLSAVVGGVKSRTSNELGFRVWQAGFFDRALRQEEDIRTVARYIVANPLRAGLVDSVANYPHWDAEWV